MNKTLLSVSFLATLLSGGSCFADLEPVEDTDLGGVTGAGLAILPQNTRIVFDPLAYLRMIPRGAPVNSSGGGFTDRAADLFFYGLAFTGADYTVAGLNTIASANSIANWGTESNPWVFRAISTTDPDYGTGSTSTAFPILQYSAPRYTSAADFTDPTVMNLKYGFYGDIAICNTGTPTYGSTAGCGGLGAAAKLQSISVWDGFSFNGSKYSIFQSRVDYGPYVTSGSTNEFEAITGTKTGTFGAVWLNRINSNTTGVLRFGVGGPASNVNLPETVLPVFNSSEGVRVTGLDINMTIGHLHYQPIIFDSQNNGNMVIEVVRIPNTAAVYNYAYQNYGLSGVDPAAASGTNPAPNIAAKMCTNATLDCADPAAAQQATHGQVSMARVEYFNNSGANVPICNSSGSSPCSAATTAASVLIDGVFIQHLKVTTLGL